MRAIFESKLQSTKISNGDLVVITDDNAHHLINVVRIKVGEDLVLLNGQGAIFSAVATQVRKREVEVTINECTSVSREHNVELAIGITKRDAFDSILKMSVELGFVAFHPLITTYSQQQFCKKDRDNRLIISAMNQSNNPYALEIADTQKLSCFPFENYKSIYYFCSNQFAKQSVNTKIKYLPGEKSLILIGPEGGLSQDEEAALLQLQNLFLIHLPLPIMRAPTAVACSIGYLLGLNR